jgi:plastocyanin
VGRPIEVDHPHMNKLTSTLVLAAVTAAVTAASALAAPPSYQVQIRHQLTGCHAWSIAGGPFRASQTLTTAPGTQLTFVDNDVMPHTLVQLAGPKVTLTTPFMHKPGATATTQLFAKGRYVFRTKAGEDYMKGVKTVGADNVLRLVVVVR